MPPRLAHVCFTVGDLERSIAFYCDTLGFARAFDFTDDSGARYGAYIKTGPRTFIELFAGGSRPTGDEHSYKHICLEVDDIEQTVADLRGKGVDVGEISLGMDQSYQAWLADPDGNRIELHCYTDTSWQGPHLD
jgi:catechol 2,3-dioxygenase-like lactoylglutathione lyase family enzyme